MAVTAADPNAQPESGPGPGGPPRRRSRFARMLADPARVWHYFGTPVIVILAMAALLIYLSGVEITQRMSTRLDIADLQIRGWEHIYLGLIATVAVIAVAVPLGVVLTRPFARKFTPLAVGIANAGQAIPSFGLLTLLAITIGIGQPTAVIGVVIYCILPVLRNTMVGIQQVDPNIIEAGRGMGMTRRAVLWRIELPLAVPVMLAGVRTALILAFGTITLAALIGAGTLGLTINAGIVSMANPVLITGAVLTASLALTIDWLAAIVEDLLRPKGL